jgi:hypothetical protein
MSAGGKKSVGRRRQKADIIGARFERNWLVRQVFSD